MRKYGNIYDTHAKSSSALKQFQQNLLDILTNPSVRPNPNDQSHATHFHLFHDPLQRQIHVHTFYLFLWTVGGSQSTQAPFNLTCMLGRTCTLHTGRHSGPFIT